MKNKNFILRLIREDEKFAAENIAREAHWDGEWDAAPTICDVHLLAHRLFSCAAYVPELSFVAEADGRLVGHIMYARCKIVAPDGAEHEVLTFGPLSVLPEAQGCGIGTALMRRSFDEAKRLGAHGVLIFGYPDYYPRAGFRRAAEFGITTADGTNFDAFMAYPLYDGAFDGISGRFIIDPVYDNLSREDVDAFDKKFPPKELHTPVPLEVLLDRLPPAARDAFEKGKSLRYMTTKSEREIRETPGVCDEAMEIIRATMHEHGFARGSAKTYR
ncbi:MAG: N-acetyltransferase [Defluviitaleaceae bacterium]|nr:N-acetyltransferase [Defluviitaleaceae bacterium]